MCNRGQNYLNGLKPNSNTKYLTFFYKLGATLKFLQYFYRLTAKR